MLRARVAFLNELLAARRVELDAGIDRFCALRADPRVPRQMVESLLEAGMIDEDTYNEVAHLTMAIDIVDMLADQIKNELSWDRCECQRCKYFASDKWLREQPFDLALETLPPRRYHTTYPDEKGWGQVEDADEDSRYSYECSVDDDSNDDDSDGEILETPRRAGKVDSPITGANSNFDECSERQTQWLNDMIAAGSPSRADPSRVLFYSQESDDIDAIAGV
jgi:hypothetical protein